MNTRIKELRKTLGLSQSEFAIKIGIGQTGISSIERGNSIVTDRTINQIVSTFGVDEHWLRTGEGEPFPLPPQEDLDLQDAFFALQVDDMDPFRKSLARAALELIATLPEEAMPALKKFLTDANAALDTTEKDED